MLQQVATYPIIYQVADGKAWTQKTANTLAVSTIQFENRHRVARSGPGVTTTTGELQTSSVMADLTARRAKPGIKLKVVANHSASDGRRTAVRSSYWRPSLSIYSILFALFRSRSLYTAWLCL